MPGVAFASLMQFLFNLVNFYFISSFTAELIRSVLLSFIKAPISILCMCFTCDRIRVFKVGNCPREKGNKQGINRSEGCFFINAEKVV